jgi:hypothetical protein
VRSFAIFFGARTSALQQLRAGMRESSGSRDAIFSRMLAGRLEGVGMTSPERYDAVVPVQYNIHHYFMRANSLMAAQIDSIVHAHQCGECHATLLWE